MVGLERDFYNADRDDVVAVCITVSSPDIVCPVEFPFSVRVETADGNAGSAIDKLGCDTYLQHSGSFGMCVDSKMLYLSIVLSKNYLHKCVKVHSSCFDSEYLGLWASVGGANI